MRPRPILTGSSPEATRILGLLQHVHLVLVRALDAAPAASPHAPSTHALSSLLHGVVPAALLQVGRYHAPLTPLQELWAYITLGASAIIAEEMSPLVGGLAARSHHLHFTIVALSITAGTWASHVLLYFLGRWHGEWVTRRWPKLKSFLTRALRLVGRHPWRSSLAVRWAYGLRLTLPLACGAAHVPLWLFVIGSGLSALSWSFLFTLVGWGFGEAAVQLLGHLRRYEKWLIVAIVIGVAAALYWARRRHVEDEMVEILATGDEERPP